MQAVGLPLLHGLSQELTVARACVAAEINISELLLLGLEAMGCSFFGAGSEKHILLPCLVTALFPSKIIIQAAVTLSYKQK